MERRSWIVGRITENFKLKAKLSTLVEHKGIRFKIARMKAVRFHEHGAPSVLKLDDVPRPQPGDNEVLINVKACSVNHLDIWIRKGIPGMKTNLPHIPGSDAAGIVAETGKGVQGFKTGDRVLINPSLCCGQCEFCSEGNGSLCLSYSIYGEHQDGTYCEYIAVPHQNVLKIPDSLDFIKAAAAPLVYLTAWRMMVTKTKVKPSDCILIFSAAAGVGIACLQIAKLVGATVIATSSSDQKCEFLKKMGADYVFNHSKEDTVRKVRDITSKRGVDIVVDYIGKETWLKGIYSLKRGGCVVTCGATSGYNPEEDLRHIFYRQVRIYGSTMGSNKEFSDAMTLVLGGKLIPHVDSVLRIDEAVKAHEMIEQREVIGKIVLSI
ncbi:MAG: zinc-binding dehydrogenase [Planctomycetes bacterium]|nr:zinc-binding dehydrogenase [Planctomycetota bacterium]